MLAPKNAKSMTSNGMQTAIVVALDQPSFDLANALNNTVVIAIVAVTAMP